VSEFVSTSEAYRIARERASVAAALESSTLHTAIYDAREEGMSIPETAAALQVPKSTVSLHWREEHRCPRVVPTWGSESAWREAHSVIWAHNPRELADDFVPYEWSDEGEQRTIRSRARGMAALRQQNADGND